MDAPYRAEYVLNRLVALFKAGHDHLAPNFFAITTVMDSYSHAKHPDAARNAERLLKLTRELNEEYGASKLVVNTAILNSVIFAWLSCGDENAAVRADVYLERMERQFENGVRGFCPDSKSYLLVLSAWSKSNSPEKPQRALAVLRRMINQCQNGNHKVHADEHAYSLVINACAFSNAGPETESEAFDIAVIVLNEMVASKDVHPTSLTYGWFIQACGRLNAPEPLRNAHIEQAFTRCCSEGLVNDFVLQRLRGAASDEVYHLLMNSVLGRERSKGRLSSALPSEWTRNCSKRKVFASKEVPNAPRERHE
jgi:hypothetical protein